VTPLRLTEKMKSSFCDQKRAKIKLLGIYRKIVKNTKMFGTLDKNGLTPSGNFREEKRKF
jgi:hypothetical protein